ncbi:hypothetical protein CN568_19660 [Bacillus pseudomycoides]|uniref:Uncharacterized protein n=3 Tax=Bacillaceae TaxID=186817 RepID=A0AAJ1YZ53_9BACI|nr:Mutator mutT protein (7,8-dihydro-8-oxoguanine-triphosphatase) [Bacillus pseudomycoides]EEM12714.1 Mutator mutT protein (7,8-dihydro-8-oxoguanine-triphosphatase) [Bacillus pseudomycoides]KFN15015.1 mutT/NUDIX family protein [Bacillus pseudomycoides]MDR4189151.1 hypothetical protein [Bacillus pseudomycoides]MDR4326435.1 hypothetical protein [Bacillus pseudomycoides]
MFFGGYKMEYTTPRHIVAVSAYIKYITRPHMKSRTLDAIKAKNFIPYETWKVDPYDLIGRL